MFILVLLFTNTHAYANIYNVTVFMRFVCVCLFCKFNYTFITKVVLTGGVSTKAAVFF